ncbi:alpha-amylase family glycosyl hydrolase [Gracilibacillus sp. S3-1-1]|uniref:Alpha-amylase family glycosyl hydrolase n=1 Tax=Gracilibacillus pellucidus TaxID=3095368 RepID=A0ACC6M453_9BACI|nr:alpha-amylase family glycosyl hydrolase [Gracilibacillus sp. S3-1-1]MDX8045765.1 alpha-amylase family glycosyl hydrolase [Gracilibacillus sp. S3-1-1]
MQYIRKIVFILFLLLCVAPSLTVMADEEMEERIYYILVDRYVNGDNSNDIDINIDDPSAYHGGDLQGIIDKLPTISDLGITTINLSPIMTADSYHGFDPLDHQTIDPQFGSVADLQNLVNAAHENDIKIILDYAISHVSAEHSLVSEQSGWIAESSMNPLAEELPTVDLNREDVQQYFIETAIYWMNNAEVDGFHVYVNEQTPRSFIDELRQRINAEKEDALLIIDGANDENGMNPVFQTEIVDILKQPGQSLEELFSENIPGVHYVESALTSRFAHEAVKEGYHPITRWKLAVTLLYTLPGSTFLYQGVEVPMDNGVDEPDHRMAELNKEDDELVHHLEKLATIRKTSHALADGDLELIEQSGAMSVYKRSTPEQVMYVAINNDTETQVASLVDIDENMQLRGLLEDNIVRQQRDGTYKVILDRETSNIFILEEDSGFNWFFISMMVIIFGGFVAFIIAVGVKNRQFKKQA